jgi:hypothetical protein
MAVELEAYNRVEHKSHLRATLAEAGEDTNSLSAMLTKLTEKFDKLQKDIDEMKGPNTLSCSQDFNRDLNVRGHGKTKDKKCFYYHNPGHSFEDESKQQENIQTKILSEYKVQRETRTYKKFCWSK